MRLRYFSLFACLLLGFTFSSCTIRLVDFTVISSKNVDIGKPEGIRTTGSKGYILGFGWNVKDALDDAIRNAGNEYDMLVDGVVRYTSYPFYTVVTVEGTAVNSTELMNSMGATEYEKYFEIHKPLDIEAEEERLRGEEE